MLGCPLPPADLSDKMAGRRKRLEVFTKKAS
jgi:hypothetical protein